MAVLNERRDDCVINAQCWVPSCAQELGAVTSRAGPREYASRAALEAQGLDGPQQVSLNEAGLGTCRLLLHDDIARYSHIDDHITMGPDPVKVLAAAKAWAAAVTSLGFVVKEEPTVRVPDKYVGFTYTERPARWKLARDRLGLLDASLLYAVECKGLPVSTMQSLVGVLVWALLLRRPLLSVLQYTFYDLVKHKDRAWMELSPAVRKELSVARS